VGRTLGNKDLAEVAKGLVEMLNAPMNSRRALEEHFFILGVLEFEDLICGKNEQGLWALRESGTGAPTLKNGEREIYFKSREFAEACALAVEGICGTRPMLMEVA